MPVYEGYVFVTAKASSYKAFKKRYPKGVQLEAVDDVLVVGICEVCGEPIPEGVGYKYDHEGVIWHDNESDCESETPKKRQKKEKKNGK